MKDDSLSDVQNICDCDIGMCTHRINCRNNPLKLAQDEMNKAVADYGEANCSHGIAMDICCELCEKERIKREVAMSVGISVMEKETWNAAIEAAALKIKEQYDHFGDAVIRHYKPMWIEEIRKLKKI